jgi:hypothetical protein
LVCFKGKDAGLSAPPPSLTLDSPSFSPSFIASGCEIKTKAASVCFPMEKNSGDDTRGGAISAFGYACYKVKCDTSPVIPGLVPTLNLFDQFEPTGRPFQFKKIFTICAPFFPA